MVASGARGAAHRRHQLLAAALVAALAAAWTAPAVAYRFTVDQKECLELDVPDEGDVVTGSVVVYDYDSSWRDVHAAIDMTVSGPAGNHIYNIQGKSEDRFQFRAPRAGPHKFCIINKSHMPESVDFHVTLGHELERRTVAKDEDFNPLVYSVHSIVNVATLVISDQEYYRSREARHRQTIESTSKRVVWYALAEAVTLVGASTLQVLILRRLFEKRSGPGRA
eukprot:SM000073S21423  [mRNA]  locus=s73:112528:114189:- [translate_table: standard]